MSTVVSSPRVTYTPDEIVALWRRQFETELAPWICDKKTYEQFQTSLSLNIDKKLKAGEIFTAADLTNSLRVATDAAKICKILQPDVDKYGEVTLDTLQIVLTLCARHHKVCQGGHGAGGWCDG